MIFRILFLLALNCGLAKGESQKPNVLFIVIDDMNDSISLLDPKSPIKTHMQRLEAETSAASSCRARMGSSAPRI